MSSVRRATVEDVEEFWDVIFARFLHAFPHMNPDAVRTWIEGNLDHKRLIFLRSDMACGAAMLTEATVFEPFVVAQELFVASKEGASPFEAMAIYRALKEWATQNKAKAFDFGSANGYDILPFAKRLGAEKRQTIYRMEI